MRYIKLSNGMKAKVNNKYDYLSCFNWTAHLSHSKRTWYAQRTFINNGIKSVISMHREVLGLKHGDGIIVDHIDGNGLNNTIENLRKCSKTSNAYNRPKRRNTSSKFIGVCWNNKSGNWLSQVRFKGRLYHIGCFNNEKNAAIERDKLASKLMGKYARLNFK